MPVWTASRRRLASIIATMSVLLVVSSAIGLTLIGELSATRMTDTLIDQRGHTVVAGLERRLTDSRRSKEIFAQLLAAEQPIADAIVGSDPTEIARALVAQRTRLGLEEIRAYDSTGQLLLRLTPVDGTWNPSALVTAARAGVTSSATAATSDGLVVAAAAPVKNADGIVGVVLVARTFQAADFEDLTGSGDVYVAVFENGDLIAISDRIANEPVSAILEAGEDLVSGRFAAVPLTLEDSHTLVALIDVEDVLNARRLRQGLVVLGTAFVSALAAWMAIRISRRVIKPIDEMMEVAQTIGKGRYDLRLPTYDVVELDTLAETINQLAANVDERDTGQRNALALSEQRWRRTFEGAAAGVVLLHPETRMILEANAAACEMLGFEEATLMTVALDDLCHPDDRDLLIGATAQATGAEGAAPQTRVRYKRADGSTGHAVISIALVTDADARPLHVVGQLVDITDRIEAEALLEELLASKERLVASVSHELRTPLTAIVGYAQLLNDPTLELDPPDRQAMISSIAAEGTDLSDIIEDLLAAARAESGQLTVAREVLELGSQVEHVLAAAAHGLAGRSVEFSEGSARVLGDPSRVRQIIRNLVSNGIRYGGDHIMVSIVERSDVVELVVEDDGEGIPEDRWESIFEPYERAHGNPGLTASVGLGLTVSQQLARLMGGELSYRYEDGRSMFVLTLRPADADVDAEV